MFLNKYYHYRLKPKINNSNYLIYYQALLYFIASLSSLFDSLDKNSLKVSKSSIDVFDKLYNKIINLI